MEYSEIRAALNRHWAASTAEDQEPEHQIYDDDAIYEYPIMGRYWQRSDGRIAHKVRRLRRTELPVDTVGLARYLINESGAHPPDGTGTGRIVETEAYVPGDKAGRAFAVALHAMGRSISNVDTRTSTLSMACITSLVSRAREWGSAQESCCAR